MSPGSFDTEGPFTHSENTSLFDIKGHLTQSRCEEKGGSQCEEKGGSLCEEKGGSRWLGIRGGVILRDPSHTLCHSVSNRGRERRK